MEFLQFLQRREEEQHLKPPYPAEVAILGGHPTVALDVPITLAFLAMYIACGITHISIHHLNSKRGHKFHLSGLTFDFCLARTCTCIMRIVWATRPHNVHVAITSEIFVNAGTVMLFAINAMFSQRIIRAVHPNFGWNKHLGWFFIFFYTSIIIVVSMNITSLVTYHYTLNPSVMLKCREIQLFGICWYTFLAIFPIFFVGIGCAIPSTTQVEKFGTGRFRSKAMLVCLASFILTIGTGFRMITAFFERPIARPAWFHSKACFYGFVFSVEIVVIIVYAIVRVDRRFHVPDGSKRPGDYSSVNLHKTDHDSYVWGEEIFECPSCSQRTSMRSSIALPRGTRPSSYNNSQLHIPSRPRSQSGPSGPSSPLIHNFSSPLAHESPLLPLSPTINQNDWPDVPGIAQHDGQKLQHPPPIAHGPQYQQRDDRIEFAHGQRSSS